MKIFVETKTSSADSEMNLTEPKKEKFSLLLDFSNWKQAGIELNAFMLKWNTKKNNNSNSNRNTTQHNNNNNNKS